MRRAASRGRIAAQVRALEQLQERRAVLVLLAEIVQQRGQHDVLDRHAQRLQAVHLVLLGARVLIHRQREAAGQLHHAEIRAILALKEGGGVRRAVDLDVLLAGVAGKDVRRERVDVDVGLREMRNVAPPPLERVWTHHPAHPPAIAPTTRNGSAPEATASGSRDVGRVVRHVLFARVEADERPPLQRHVIAHGALKHGIRATPAR